MSEDRRISSNIVEYRPIDRIDTLVRCNRCGAVVEGDVVGQSIHNIWHDNEEDRARIATGMNLLS
jgi:hypothetical protein